MNILIIGDFCYPNYMGGSSKHVYDLITQFSNIESINFKLITRQKQEGNYSADEKDAEIIFNHLKESNQVIELSRMQLFNPLNYIKHINESDIVIIQHPIMGCFGAVMAKMNHKPIIYHYHGPIHEEYKIKSGKKGIHYKILWLFQKITVLCATKVLTHSEYMRNIAIKEHSLSISKSLYLPPYIERKDVHEPLKNFKSNNKTKFLIPRRLTTRTGVIEFIHSFLSLPKDTRNQYDIYISGKGELKNEVELLVKKDSDNLSYVGFLSYNELWSMYQLVDAVIVPTLDLEGFGYIILEAMSCGASALVSKTCGGGYEFVLSHLGEKHTFDVFSPQSITSAMQHISKIRNNRNMNSSIADKYTINQMIDYYINEVIPKCLKDHSR